MMLTALKIVCAALCCVIVALACLLVESRAKYRVDMEKAVDIADTLMDRCQVAEDTLTLVFGQPWNPDKLRTTEVSRATYYTLKTKTSQGKPCRIGGAALHNSVGVEYGQRFVVAGNGMVLERNDHMPSSVGLDIWQPDDAHGRQMIAELGDGPQTIIWMDK